MDVSLNYFSVLRLDILLDQSLWFIANKILAFHEIIEKISINPEHVAHVGDDLLDLPLMVRVGLSVAVQDANFAVKQHADWCTTLSGGCGAVREVCDLIMQAQGNFDDILSSYLKW